MLQPRLNGRAFDGLTPISAPGVGYEVPWWRGKVRYGQATSDLSIHMLPPRIQR